MTNNAFVNYRVQGAFVVSSLDVTPLVLTGSTCLTKSVMDIDNTIVSALLVYSVVHNAMHAGRMVIGPPRTLEKST